MATKSFMLNTEPHRAEVGEYVFLFSPEVLGAEFAEAYSDLKDAQKTISAAGDNVGAAELKAVHEGMRNFINRFLLDESRTAFHDAQLPDRVLTQLLEWIAGLYGGGGSGNDRGGPSSQS